MVEVYDIYHDESKEESYWHGFLFVPRSGRRYLLGLLIKARGNIKFYKEISYKDIRRTDRPTRKRPALVESWTSIALAALQQQKLLKLPTPFHLGGNPKEYIARLNKLIKCKFVVFKERDKHRKMFSGLDGLACIETTFRMGIKGGIHRLFNENNPIIVGNVFIDGDKHYIREYGRKFDVKRSLRRFAIERRSYVNFLRSSKLIPQHSNHNKIKPHQKIEDSYFLQLCDILIGGVRFHSFCPDSCNIKYRISLPCRELLSRAPNKYFRTRESRFFNGFTLGEAYLESGNWEFISLQPGEDKAISRIKQLKLPLFV